MSITLPTRSGGSVQNRLSPQGCCQYISTPLGLTDGYKHWPTWPTWMRPTDFHSIHFHQGTSACSFILSFSAIPDGGSKDSMQQCLNHELGHATQRIYPARQMDLSLEFAQGPPGTGLDGNAAVATMQDGPRITMDRTDSPTSFATATSQPGLGGCVSSRVWRVSDRGPHLPKEGPTCTFAGIPLGESGSLVAQRQHSPKTNYFEKDVQWQGFQIPARFSIFSRRSQSS